MRAVVVERFGAPEVLVVRDVPPPAAGPGEVVVDVRAAGVNYPDLLVVGGSYQILPPLPFTPGKEIAGVVREVGEGVTRLEPGQRALARSSTAATNSGSRSRPRRSCRSTTASASRRQPRSGWCT